MEVYINQDIKPENLLVKYKFKQNMLILKEQENKNITALNPS